MIILAIDPALRHTGFAVLSVEGRVMRALEYGTIVNPAKRTEPECLLSIHSQVTEVIARHSPEVCAVEGVIFVQSYKTAISMGAARGSAILAAAAAGIPIHEYAPKRVKQAVSGRGGAAKGQVAFMVRALLKLTETPASDEADALAIAITHAQSIRPLGLRS